MKHAAFVLALGVFAGASFGGVAYADDVTDLAKQAQSDVKAGKNLEAYDTMRKAALQVWNEGPLLFRKALFVTKPPTGFGIYNPRPDSVFKPGEKLILYVEPVGFTWKPQNGLNHAALAADLVLKGADGTIIGEQEGFATFTFDSRDENLEVMSAVTIDFTEAPAGKYEAELKFTDQNGDKSATFSLPFEIKADEEASSAQP